MLKSKHRKYLSPSGRMFCAIGGRMRRYMHSNAVKFTDRSGSIHVKANYFMARSTLQLRVCDTGVGIEAEKQQKIFSPFEQEDKSISKSHGGTGLGLSISLSLIEMMHGELVFESTKEVGSTFGFNLPLPLCPNKASFPTHTQLQGHILVLYAKKNHRMILGVMLESLGLTFTLCDHSAMAESLLSTGTFNLIILDPSLGFDSSRHPDLPSLLIDESAESQAPNTLAVPFEIDTLEVKLKHYM